jgi:hypothetical protein
MLEAFERLRRPRISSLDDFTDHAKDDFLIMIMIEDLLSNFSQLLQGVKIQEPFTMKRLQYQSICRKAR